MSDQPESTTGISDEDIRRCLCVIGDRINPKCLVHNLTTAAEWTEDSIAWVKQEFPDAWQHKLADALAAAGQANIRTNEMLTNVRHERDEAQKQLAAEREKREAAEQRAAAYHRQLGDENKMTEQLLAAEREAHQGLLQCVAGYETDLHQLREQRDEAIRLLHYKSEQLAEAQVAIAKVEEHNR